MTVTASSFFFDSLWYDILFHLNLLTLSQAKQRSLPESDEPRQDSLIGFLFGLLVLCQFINPVQVRVHALCMCPVSAVSEFLLLFGPLFFESILHVLLL